MTDNWSLDLGYLQKQKEAMRWLYEQGLSPDEIRLLRWGAVDELEKTLRATKKVVILKADLENPDVVKYDEYEKEFKIPLQGTKCEWFFLKSRIMCAWMFAREFPRSWRREKSKASLFTPAEIKRIIEEDVETTLKTGINALTNDDFFATIESSNLNITKMKTKELAARATEAS